MFKRQRPPRLLESSHERSRLSANVERAKDGDVDAWETIYRELYPRLHSFARYRLPAQHLVDDAISETMFRALRQLPGFQADGAGFEPWMFGILRNVAHESTRSYARSRELTDSAASSERAPLAEVIAAEERDHVRIAFERLSSDEQELLALRTIAQLSSTECGLVLGRSPEAIRTAQSRALKKLRTIHEEVCGE